MEMPGPCQEEEAGETGAPSSWQDAGFCGSEGRSPRPLGSALSSCKFLRKTKLGEDSQKILEEMKGGLGGNERILEDSES